MKKIIKRIKKIVIDILDIQDDQIKKKTNLFKKMKLDSLDKIELIMALEEEFKIEISDEISDKFKNIIQIASHIHEIKNNAKK